MEEAITNKDKKAFKTFMVYASKFSLIREVLFAAFYSDENDLLYKSPDHEDWIKVYEVYESYEPKDFK